MNLLFNYFKKNVHQSFFLKVVVLIFFIFLIDFAFGHLLEYFYFKQESGFLYRTTYSIEETTSDVLIFGASTANHHYHPDAFEERLKLSYYNAGRDGNSIFYHYAVLRSVLNRFTPKIVILDIGRGEFWQNQANYDRLSALLPYYKKHPEIRSIIERKSKYEKIKLISNIYPYNSLILSIAMGNAEINKQRFNEKKGYVPLFRSLNGTINTDNNLKNYALDTAKINTYKAFIKDCVKSKVKLFVVCSPYFIKSTYQDSSLIIAQDIAAKYNIHFYDYSNHSIFITNPQYFEDIYHLNNTGARVFSDKLIDSILNINNTQPVNE